MYGKKSLLLPIKNTPKENVHICSYVSLSNEVTIKDIAEGFERALRINTKINLNEPFDAIVHSTGMLVLRSWLAVYGENRKTG